MMGKPIAVIANDHLLEVERLRAENAKLQAERDSIMRALESLTPLGSEYYNDPARCVGYVQDSKRMTVQFAKERNELRAANAELHTLIDTQAGIISRKNDEIAELSAALGECIGRNEEDALYAPALGGKR
jgi:ABC-type transporter Mla subunit MlaD